MPTYREVAAKSIHELVEYSKESTMSDILLDVIEMLLSAEREKFLKETPAVGNKANGHYERFLKSLTGKISLRVPRDRMGQFHPLLLEVIKTDDERMSKLACSLYAKGVSQRDIGDIISEIYNANASASWVSQMAADTLSARNAWHAKQINDEYLAVYLDALFVPIRRDSVEKEAVYVALGLKLDGRREVLGLYTLPTESATGWAMMFDDMKKRGLKKVSLFIADGLTGLPEVVANAFPASCFQSCVVHKMRNVLLHVRSKDKAEVAAGLKKVFDLDRVDDSTEEAIVRLDAFIEKTKKIYPHIANQFPEELKPRLFTYLDYPPTLRRMIYTTNWIERLNKHIRKVIKNKNSFPSEVSAMNLIFLAIMNFETRVYCYPIYAVASL
jgi:transposase-like protein